MSTNIQVVFVNVYKYTEFIVSNIHGIQEINNNVKTKSAYVQWNVQ